MQKAILVSLCLIGLTACSQGEAPMQDRTMTPCGDKPNCVSTQDPREEYYVNPFQLKENANLAQIEKVALQLPGAKLAKKESDYLHIECTSKIMRFVDDLELKIMDGVLVVRSESRVGHSDFGVNRKRVDQLRKSLKEADLIY